MQMLEFYLDGRAVALTPGPGLDKERVLVPLFAFCEAVGAGVKRPDGGAPLTVCKGDLCIPLNAADTVSVDGGIYASLNAFGGALGLRWAVEGNALRVTSGPRVQTGLGIGYFPPDFTLPDLYTGERVSLSDYRGKKAVFYIWASW